MCSSKPKIPDNKTPPAPLAPEAAPDAPTIGDRRQMARARGMTIDPKPDLSGLGNQIMGLPTSFIRIGPADQRSPGANRRDETIRSRMGRGGPDGATRRSS